MAVQISRTEIMRQIITIIEELEVVDRGIETNSFNEHIKIRINKIEDMLRKIRDKI